MENRPTIKEYRELVELIYIDIINGISRSTIVEKLMDGDYEGYEFTINYKKATITKAIRHAVERFSFDREEDKNNFRNIMLGRYENLYAEALEAGDRLVARQTLDSVTKLTGIAEPERIDVTGLNFFLDFTHKTGVSEDEEE